ncbi:MAG: NAD(P)H-hydrate dehydratase [Hyphomicrobiaceae bacterium]
MTELLTTEEMGRADRRAVDLGIPSLTLMENAGRAVADAAWAHLQAGERVAVLCGPGNNGGDGFVAARLLAERGCDVKVALLGEMSALKGDAAEMAGRWKGRVVPLQESAASDAKVIVDAIFGAGLSRDIGVELEPVLKSINDRPFGQKLISVDVPSGLDGNTGQVRGRAVRADETVTFMCMKPGHVLLPGRSLCGHITIADIGIPADVLLDVGSRASVADGGASKEIAGWFPWREPCAHKYAHGHAVVVSGPAFQTGAARLAARGALRIGAGLVTVASPPSALPENAAHLTAVMLKPCPNRRALSEILADTRKNAVLIGPGAGAGPETAELVLAALASGAAVVLDADAITSFAVNSGNKDGVAFGFTSKVERESNSPQALFEAVRSKPERPVVLTPHDGEFKRLFPDLADKPSKLERAREAARQTGAAVILKGADTVVAFPDGRAVVNANAPPWLATAGTGDVLAGFVTGLLAQAVPAFEAAATAVWLHGECANVLGPGLISEDLAEVLPGVLATLLNSMSETNAAHTTPYMLPR